MNLADQDPPVLVLGGGGHGRVVFDAVRLSGLAIAGVVDPRRPVWLPDGVPHFETEHEAFTSHRGSVCAALGCAPLPNSALAAKLWRLIQEGPALCCTVVHPGAIIAQDATLEPGCQVMAGAVVQSGACIKGGAIINTGSIVEHDVVVGELAHVAPGSVVLGGCSLGDGAFVGAGAMIHPNVQVGRNAVIAMGAVVVRNVEAEGKTYGALRPR